MNQCIDFSRIVFAASLLVSAASLAACSAQVCTGLGCVPSATVSFSKALSEPGTYRVEAKLDGNEVQCEITVPGYQSNCDSLGAVTWALKHPVENSESGSTQVGNPEAITGVSVSGKTYESFALRVLRDGDLLAEGTIKPNYVGEEINGPGCGTCDHGEAQLSIP